MEKYKYSSPVFYDDWLILSYHPSPMAFNVFLGDAILLIEGPK